MDIRLLSKGNLTFESGTFTANGGALYINGNLQGDDVKANPSEIIIRSTAKITPSKSNVIYGAGYANWTIEDGATISGTEVIITKAGKWLIKGGTFTSTATALASLPPVPDGDGAEITNATISLIGNSDYADP